MSPDATLEESGGSHAFDPPTARGEERSREGLYDTRTNSNTPLSLYQPFTEIAQVTGFGTM